MSAISLCSAVAEEGNAVPFPEIALQGSWKKRKEARKKTGLFPYASCEFIANILTLKLISMNTRNN